MPNQPSDAGDPNRSWSVSQLQHATPAPSDVGRERAELIDEALEDQHELPQATPTGPKSGSTGHVKVRHHPELG